MGAVLFTINLRRLAHFYESVAGMRVVRDEDDHVVLERDSFRLTIHQIPEQYAKSIVITTPPIVRESSAIKLSFRVDDIAQSRQTAAESGGLIYGPEREWSDETNIAVDGYDSDGNVIQLIQTHGK